VMSVGPRIGGGPLEGDNGDGSLDLLSVQNRLDGIGRDAFEGGGLLRTRDKS
jgi:hypothetical protein